MKKIKEIIKNNSGVIAAIISVIIGIFLFLGVVVPKAEHLNLSLLGWLLIFSFCLIIVLGTMWVAARFYLGD